jgi:hypothetical protein
MGTFRKQKSPIDLGQAEVPAVFSFMSNLGSPVGFL